MNRRSWILSIGVGFLCLLLLWWLYVSILAKEDEVMIDYNSVEQPLIVP